MEYQISQLSLKPTTLRSQLNKKLDEAKNMIILFGSCSGLFDGRIKSSISEGDRILIIKEDLTIILHDPVGVKPIQWQRPGVGPVIFVLSDNKLKMETYRPKTNESFFITFSEIYQAITYDTQTKGDQSAIIGDEKDFVKFLVNNPEIIESGLKIIDHERETDVGFIDILAEDISKYFVVIEVKKQAANPSDAYQLKRYVEFFEKQNIQNIRGILIAPAFPKKVKKYLKNAKLEECTIPWQDIFPTMKRPTSIPISRNLEEFFN
ncbi:MAG: endonuclease NucS domain-containing protein [Candidatus Hodarchaeota archaeon]